MQLLRQGGKGEEMAEALEDIEYFSKRFKTPDYRRNKIKHMLESNKSLLKYISEMLLLLEDAYKTRHRELLSKRSNP